MPVSIYYEKGHSCFGGDLTLHREFYNTKTAQFIWLEGHQVGNSPTALPTEQSEGSFHTAIWTESGNDGYDSIPQDLTGLVQWMQNYQPPEGFVEGPIPSYIYEGTDPSADGK